MSEQTPSQAEGERDDEEIPSPDAAEAPRTTPSQAEGEDADDQDGTEDAQRTET